MKLVSQASEVRALKTICSGDEKIAALVLGAVQQSSFKSPPAADVYRRVLSYLRAEGELPSWEEVCNDPVISEAHRSVLKQIKEKPLKDLAKVKSLTQNLDKYRQLRALVNASNLVVDASNSDSVDVGKLLENVTDELTKARLTTDSKKNLFHTGKGNNTAKVIKNLLDPPAIRYVPTGFKNFDSKNGGFLYGSLITLAANTGGGKTVVACNLAYNIANWAMEDTCLVSLEMTEDQIEARYIGIETGLDVTKITNGKLSKGEKKLVSEAYAKRVKRLKENNTRLTTYVPDGEASIEEILLVLKPYNYTTIIVDYIGLLKGADDDAQALRLGAISRYAKVWANSNNKIVVLLAQLDDKTKNIRYARAIRENSNNAWFWFTPEDETDVSILDVRQAKARNQKKFNFSLAMENACMRVTDFNSGEGSSVDEEVVEKTRKTTDEYMQDINDGESDDGDDDDEEEDEE